MSNRELKLGNWLTCSFTNKQGEPLNPKIALFFYVVHFFLMVWMIDFAFDYSFKQSEPIPVLIVSCLVFFVLSSAIDKAFDYLLTRYARL